MKPILKTPLKYVLLLAMVIVLISIDVVTSRVNALAVQDPNIDSLIFESGSFEVDGYTSASIQTHVSLVRSDLEGLSFSKKPDAVLTNAEIREMVYKAIALDVHWGTNIPELKYKISRKGANCWVSIMPNINTIPGERYNPGDVTDPRVIWAVLDYIADSTDAKRISLLAGGTYPTAPNEKDIFEFEQFTTKSNPVVAGNRWNTQYPDLPDSFTLQKMMDWAMARNPGKIIEGINSNYNEIMEGGIPYNQLSPAEQATKKPEYYPLPMNNSYNISVLRTTNTIADTNKYNPTDAVLNCDVLVNVPVMKTTAGPEINCVLKNYVGSVSRGTYGVGSTYPRGRSTSLAQLEHEAGLGNTVLNLFSIHPSDYSIVDGLLSLEGPGSHPSLYKTGVVRRNFVMAGGDPLAVEAIAGASMNLNPNDVTMLRYAVAKGYGVIDFRRIATIGTPLDSVRTDFIAPVLSGPDGYPGFAARHYFPRACRRWLLNGPYTAADNNTAHIDESGADPRPGDSINGLAWRPTFANSNVVDLATILKNPADQSVEYAFTQIFSEYAQSGLLYVGGVRDIKVFVNGAKIIDTTDLLLYNEVAVVKPVTLVRGDNRILVKVRKSGAKFQFSLGVVNDGLQTQRTTYVLHYFDRALTKARTIPDSTKRGLFGGRTLFGTFYHLGQSDPVATEVATVATQPNLTLEQNSPNPFQGTTRISFNVPANRMALKLEIVDARGRVVQTVRNGNMNKGKHSVSWNGTDLSGHRLAAGVYFARLTSMQHTLVRKMVLAR